VGGHVCIDHKKRKSRFSKEEFFSLSIFRVAGRVVYFVYSNCGKCIVFRKQSPSAMVAEEKNVKHCMFLLKPSQGVLKPDAMRLDVDLFDFYDSWR